MPDWNRYLRTIVLLAIAGFALVIGVLWKIVALLIIAAGAFWLWRSCRSTKR